MTYRIKKYCVAFICFFVYQLIGSFQTVFDLSILHFEVLLMLYLLLLLYFLTSTKYLNDLNIFKLSNNNLKTIRYCIPLLIIPIINFSNNRSIDFQNIILCLLTVFMEELFFRGILLKTFDHFSLSNSFLLSSMFFSFYHLSNLFVSYDIIYTIFQVILSFFVGYQLCFITIKSKSLLPCIIVHFLMNITGSGVILNIYSYVLCIIVLFVYFLYLLSLIVREE